MFEIASGSIVGRDHVLTGKNNQDAYAVMTSNGVTVAVVSDGCGDPSSPYSEVGSRLGASITAKATLEAVQRHLNDVLDGVPFSEDEMWNSVYNSIRAFLLMSSKVVGFNPNEVLRKNFLFTLLVAVITEKVSFFAGIGDGVIIVNGRELRISYPENMPPYIAYALLPGITNVDPASYLFFVKYGSIATAELESFVISTDGLNDILGKPELIVPGTSQEVGPISQLWTQDRFYANPDNLRRWLVQLNRGGQRIDWKEQAVMKYHGLLHDDTTLVVGRQIKTEKADA